MGTPPPISFGRSGLRGNYQLNSWRIVEESWLDHNRGGEAAVTIVVLIISPLE